ncbi:MAG: ATP-dependent Clp protease ATP-binding subunit [Syntrophomonadaceae bacterium]|nr:ATP-dependent Clp protease ATP-binding subunit [Syntrophomonadaceae bacterium]
MFARFTERAQKVLIYSQEEARRLQHGAVGTEHLLLGLIREGESVAARVLSNLGINLEQVREKIISLVGTGPAPVQEVSLTPRTKKVLELSVDEARQLGAGYVGTEHLLLGLIREGEGVAARVLNDLGVNLQQVRSQIINMLGAGPGQILGGPPASGGRSQQGSKTPVLDQFSRDLTAYAKDGKLDPVIGRDKEIERVVQILSRRTKNNPVLVGDPGVGKTAIAEGLAQRIIKKEVPEILTDKRVLALDLSSVVAGTKYRGEFEERLKKIVDEIRNAGNVIIFIDELHTLIGAGGAEGAIDAANILKPALARGELQCIGATTLDEYRKHIEKDPALERRFQPIIVEEPSVEETIKILYGLRDRYEAHHRVKITDEAIQAAARLADRYITDRFLPDKAIDLVDEASSRVRLRSFTTPPDLKDLNQQLEEIQKEKEEAIAGQEFEKAAELRDREQKIKEELDSRRNNWKQKQGQEEANVTEEDIAHIVSSWTGIPVNKLAEEESERLIRLEEILHERVIGQDEAVQAVARAVRRARAGLKNPKRPVGSFIFLGPTGVGKTELARALAEAMFGDEDNLIRIDMSEYMEKFTVSRLVGSPPGYVGYDEGGQLTEAVRRKPYSVILFDEIEKAHPEVFNILLQLLDDGRLTDAQGRTVDFRNTIVIMTSNVGAQHLKREGVMGFRPDVREEDRYKEMQKRILNELTRTFRPEFLNRIDETIVFHNLTEAELKQIIDLMLREVRDRLAEQGIKLEVTEAAKEYLLKEGYDPAYGARPLRRAIQRLIENALSEELLRGKYQAGDLVRVDARDNNIIIEK